MRAPHHRLAFSRHVGVSRRRAKSAADALRRRNTMPFRATRLSAITTRRAAISSRMPVTFRSLFSFLFSEHDENKLLRAAADYYRRLSCLPDLLMP